MPREGHDLNLRLIRVLLADFNPRAPRGARLVVLGIMLLSRKFQSTCPARGTTAHQARVRLRGIISIHVPREGHDSNQDSKRRSKKYFNPRAPRGARPAVSAFAFRSTDINEIKQTLEFFGIDKDDENNQKRLRDLENGQCLLQDLYGRVGVVQIHPVFEELLHAFDTRPPVQRNEVE